MKKTLLLILFLLPILSKANAQTIVGNDVVSLKTFTTVLSDVVKAEKIDDYFNPLGYKFSGMENISRHGMQGHQLTYKGDHSDFKVELIGRLKLTVTYETPLADEYNSVLTYILSTNAYKLVNHADSGLATSETFANTEYTFVFMTKKTQTGILHTISAASKLNNLVVNGDNNQ
jgi:hypothetical protein